MIDMEEIIGYAQNKNIKSMYTKTQGINQF
jgi:hypothetical protein